MKVPVSNAPILLYQREWNERNYTDTWRREIIHDDIEEACMFGDVLGNGSISETYSRRLRSVGREKSATARADPTAVPARRRLYFRDVVISESARKSTATLTRVSIMAARH